MVARQAAGVMVVVMALAGCGDDGASVGGGALDSDAARFCEISAELDEAGAAMAQSGAPAAVENFFDQEMALGAEALRIVPEEIRTDFEAVMARETALVPVYEAAGYDLSRLDADAVRSVQDDHPVPADAIRRIGAWINSNCQ